VSKLQHVAEIAERGGSLSVIRSAHPQIEIDTLECGAKLYIEPQVDELERRIAELEESMSAAITERDEIISELESELAEQCRLLGMSGEREAKLLARIAELEATNQSLNAAIGRALEINAEIISMFNEGKK
jgi:hypothetical protein